MKKIIALFLLIAFYDLNAQETNIRTNEIGLNVTSLINSVIDIGEDPASPDFNFFYRSIGAKTSYRLALQTRISNNKNDIGLSQEVKNNNRVLGLRFGVEGTKDLSKRFTLIYSWDFLVSQNHAKSENENSGFTNKSNQLSIGTGPGLRIQYDISDNISLMTESTFYAVYSKTNSKLEQFGQEEIETISSNFGITSRMPTSIFITMRF